MSEYQYYEFQAIDRPLTEREKDELRSCSSRATITATRFVNHYDWGSFKGDSSAWVEKYFDAFLYVANWGTHELTIRLPRQVLDLKTAKQYCCGESAVVRIKGDFIILEFLSNDDEEGEWEDGSGWLSSLIPLRADIAGGDHRALYLAWLLCAQNRELEDDAVSPPVPAGLDDLTASLQSFADFLRIDGDLIAVAADRSPRESQATVPTRNSEGWITVGELLAADERRAEERRRKEVERMATERAQRERETAEARERYLASLAKRETKVWNEVDTLIATKQPGRYDKAVKLLCDLRDLSLRDGREGEFKERLLQLREEHARKPTFIDRLKKACLATG